ncbi:MAG TPA: lytic polysaccharide monooxygenase [Mycobacteriales bacterium]|nr:lytic polysaccharide monooxygenase [Mycobacteriales bacterium]
MRIRRLLTLGAAAALIPVFTNMLSAPVASAHGTMMKPASRTFFCWRDGLTATGEIVPKNSACGAAVAQSGVNSLYNWFGVLRSDGAGRTKGFIPDGQLCSGGNPTYSGFDQARADWPLTHLTAGASFDWWYSNWAAHPGPFKMFVTKDTWSPTRTLSWDDLEDTPFLTVASAPQVGSVGTPNGHYLWTGNLPTAKTGRHLIYTVWARTDSQETFYSCSDVVFDGGRGEETGVGVQGAPPVALSCTGGIRIDNSWNGGFQSTVTVRNTGPVAISPWVIGWHMENGTVVSGWNASMVQDVHMVTASAPSWNLAIPPGGTVSLGFVANGSATPAPSAVSLNGTVCTA